MKLFTLTFTSRTGVTETRTIEALNARFALSKGLNIRREEGQFELTSVEPAECRGE